MALLQAPGFLPMGMGPEAAAPGLGYRSRKAALTALERFASFEERRGAQAQTNEAISPEMEQQRRAAASAKAEATAARLQTRGTALKIAPLLGGNEAAPDGADVARSSGEAPAEPAVAGSEGEGGDDAAGKGSAQANSEDFWSGGKERRYVGRVKAFSASHGFGFITCAEILKRFGCDVFLSHAVEGGIIIGSTVSFGIELNKNGKPQARRVILVDAGVVVPSASAGFVGKVLVGRVKSFNAGRGFGFLSCAEVQAAFGGRDIYVAKAQAPDGRLFPGQEVEFRLQVDRYGQPQGRDIVCLPTKIPDGELPAPASPSEAHIGLRLFG